MPLGRADILDRIDSSLISHLKGTTVLRQAGFQALILSYRGLRWIWLVSTLVPVTTGPPAPQPTMGGPRAPQWDTSPWWEHLQTLDFNQVCLGQERTLRSTPGSSEAKWPLSPQNSHSQCRILEGLVFSSFFSFLSRCLLLYTGRKDGVLIPSMTEPRSGGGKWFV